MPDKDRYKLITTKLFEINIDNIYTFTKISVFHTFIDIFKLYLLMSLKIPIGTN
jgi:hypothetical protein